MERRVPRVSAGITLAIAVAMASGACAAISGLDALSVGGDACDGACPEFDGATAAGDASVPDVRVVARADGSTCACVDGPPPGWQGPAALWDGTGTAPACGADYPAKALDALADPNAPDATCSCACAAPTGATCPTSFPVDVFTTGDCAAASKCATVTISPAACADLGVTPCVGPMAVSGGPAAAAMGASCSPIPQSQLTPLTWKRVARACVLGAAPVRESCEDSQVCVSLPAAPMSPRPCIFASGDRACPADGYSVKHLYYGGANDDRKCTTCTCGAATGVACTAHLAARCSGAGIADIFVPTTCGSVGGGANIGLSIRSAAGPDGGSCVPSGGVHDGTVTPTSPTTVCCIP